jgi:hypothetical protein
VIKIVPATMAHARAIRLRAGDAREIAALGETPETAFGRTLTRAVWAEAYLIDGEVAAIAGVVLPSLLGTAATPFLMTGQPVDRHRKKFLQLTRAGVARMLAEFPVLTNRVHAEYGEAIRWLRWLGFTIGPALRHGPLGALFHEARLERSTGRLVLRSMRARDLYRLKPNTTHGKSRIEPARVALLEQLPSFTGEVEGRIVVCAGVVPLAHAYHAWACFSNDSGPHMLPCFNACRRFFDSLDRPTRALIPEAATRWARLLGFRPTGEMDGELPVYMRQIHG